MKFGKTLIVAATSAILAAGFGAPSMARDADRAPVLGHELRDTIETALTSLRLDSGQRDKIHELLRNYTRSIRDIASNPDLRPSQRQDRIWSKQKDLRDRVMHVLRPRQRTKVDSIVRHDNRFDKDWEWMRNPAS